MSFRMVVCVDLDADDLPGAYKKLRRMMIFGVSGGAFAGWESTDEWYGKDGEAGDPAELQSAIESVLDAEVRR